MSGSVDTQCRASQFTRHCEGLLVLVSSSTTVVASTTLLDQLDNQPIARYRLHVRDFAPARFENQRHFELTLATTRGKSESTPIFRGTFSDARPAIHIPGWIDGELIEAATIDDKQLRLWDKACLRGGAVELAKVLGSTIPLGGRMWLAYEQFGDEGKSLVETRAGLAARAPILATPMGLLLYYADCWLGARDWDIPEGGREGPRKVQGNKALGTTHAREAAVNVCHELAVYTKNRAKDELQTRARARANAIVQDLANRFK